MENIASQFMAEGLESIGSVAKGLKNITIEMENNCTRCNGDGVRLKRVKRIDLDFNPEQIIDPAEFEECKKCNGSGLQNVSIKVDITKTPGIKKEEKKK